MITTKYGEEKADLCEDCGECMWKRCCDASAGDCVTDECLDFDLDLLW